MNLRIIECIYIVYIHAIQINHPFYAPLHLVKPSLPTTELRLSSMPSLHSSGGPPSGWLGQKGWEKKTWTKYGAFNGNLMGLKNGILMGF